MAWAAGNLYEGSAVKKTQCSASSEFSGTYVAVNAFDAVAGGVDDVALAVDSLKRELRSVHLHGGSLEAAIRGFLRALKLSSI